MEFTVERKVSASATELRAILDEIIAELRDRRCPCGSLDEIKLAVQEAIAKFMQRRTVRSDGGAGE